MRILHVVPYLPKASGVTTFVVECSDVLQEIGVEQVVGVKDRQHFDVAASAAGVPRIGVEEALARIREFDVVHFHGIWPPFLHRFVVAAHRHRVPIVWSPHGMLSPWAMKFKWWKKFLPWFLWQKRDLKSAEILHVTSEKELDWVQASGFRNRIVNIPLGTNLPEAVPVRRREKKTLLFVGRINPVKGLENLIRAWRNVRNDDWKLRIVGADEAKYSAALQSLVHELSLETSVEFPGPKFGTDLEEEYKNADALVLPSHTENFGGVVIDALAWGLPVITSKGTPWREVEGEKEVVVESGSGTVEESEGRGARSTVEFEIVRGEESPFCKTAEALAWARLHGLIGRMGENETGGKGVVTISAESIRETLNPRQREKSVSQSVHFAALMKLRELIRASRILEVHPDWLKDSSGKRSPAVGVNHDIAICVAYAAFGIGDVVYRVRLTLKRYRQTKSSKVYAYRVNEIEVVPGTLGGKIALTTNPTGTTSICGTILLNGALDVNGVPLLAGDEGESEVVVGSGSGTVEEIEGRGARSRSTVELHPSLSASHFVSLTRFKGLAEKKPEELTFGEKREIVRAIEATEVICLGLPKDEKITRFLKGYWDGDAKVTRDIVEWGSGLVPVSVINRYIGEIQTHKNSIRSILFHTRFRGPLKVLILERLADVLKYAVLYNKGRDGDETFYNLAHRLRFDPGDGKPAKEFIVRLIVKETAEGNRTWTVEFSNKKELTGMPTTGEAATVEVTHLKSPSTHTILKLLYAVNGAGGESRWRDTGSTVDSNTQTLKHSNNSSRCGWWVDNDPETLAKALRELMALSDEERQAMGLRGRDLVRKKYSWAAVASAMKMAYESILKGVA